MPKDKRINVPGFRSSKKLTNKQRNENYKEMQAIVSKMAEHCNKLGAFLGNAHNDFEEITRLCNGSNWVTMSLVLSKIKNISNKWSNLKITTKDILGT